MQDGRRSWGGKTFGWLLPIGFWHSDLRAGLHARILHHLSELSSQTSAVLSVAYDIPNNVYHQRHEHDGTSVDDE